MSPKPLVSVLVRACNDGAYVRRTLEGVLGQRTDFPFEVLVCDNFSVDGTSAAIAEFGSRVRSVPSPEGPYVPGVTLNAFVRAAEGEIVVFNNADAIPLDDGWLAALVRPLREGRADATFANQLPRPEASWLVKKDSERAFGDGSVSCHWPRFFSLASSAATKADLLANPFDEKLWYNEDTEWANRRPMRRVYCPDARVEHSHDYTDAQLWRRFYGEGYSERQIFGDPVPSRFRMLLSALAETARDLRYLSRHPAGWREANSPARSRSRSAGCWISFRGAFRARRRGCGGMASNGYTGSIRSRSASSAVTCSGIRCSCGVSRGAPRGVQNEMPSRASSRAFIWSSVPIVMRRLSPVFGPGK